MNHFFKNIQIRKDGWAIPAALIYFLTGVTLARRVWKHFLLRFLFVFSPTGQWCLTSDINKQRENKRDGGKFVFIIHLYIQNTGFCVDAKQEHYSCHILCLESGLSGSQSQHHCYTCSRALRGLCPRTSHLQTRRLLKVLVQLHNPALPPRLWSSSSLKLCPGYRTPLF